MSTVDYTSIRKIIFCGRAYSRIQKSIEKNQVFGEGARSTCHHTKYYKMQTANEKRNLKNERLCHGHHIQMISHLIR